MSGCAGWLCCGQGRVDVGAGAGTAGVSVMKALLTRTSMGPLGERITVIFFGGATMFCEVVGGEVAANVLSGLFIMSSKKKGG